MAKEPQKINLSEVEEAPPPSLEKRVADLEAQVRGLVPLHALVDHIAQIKRTFGAG